MIDFCFLQPDWPRFFSYAADIWQYLDKVCEVFNLREKMTFNTQVIAAEWQESSGTWKVKLQHDEPGKEATIYEDTCDVLFNGSGVNPPKIIPHTPAADINGLGPEQFQKTAP